jgi:hypothetical protein
MSSKKRKQMPVIALGRFRTECKEEGLGLECALATLAMAAVRLDFSARVEDSFQRVQSFSWAVRSEARNVIKALKKEYPDMDWGFYEQQGKKAAPAKAATLVERETEDGETDCPTPRTIWSDGNGAQQEATEPEAT